VVAGGSTDDRCPACADEESWELYVFLEHDQIVRVTVADGTYDFLEAAALFIDLDHPSVVPVRLNLQDEITRLCAAQERILTELRTQNPISEPLGILQLPKTGTLIVDQRAWLWRKHGMGVEFVSERGEVVDAHAHIDEPSRIDVWRIMNWMDGRGAVVGADQIEAALASMEASGVVQRVEGDERSWTWWAGRMGAGSSGSDDGSTRST
jgi:hypothetical protein